MRRFSEIPKLERILDRTGTFQNTRSLRIHGFTGGGFFRVILNTFFYDGNCPFCTKTASHLKSRCLNSDIRFVSFRDLNESEIRKIHKELTVDLLSGNTQFIFHGKRYPHFFGIRKLFPFLKGYRYFTLILYLPLVPLLGIFFMQMLKKFTSH
ncbi:MAG: DUF393 domain-containing protein [Leptospiraceae bacterium]|nr:DUF393 domain-containing protein [Leptospiraceae bacterium]